MLDQRCWTQAWVEGIGTGDFYQSWRYELAIAGGLLAVYLLVVVAYFIIATLVCVICFRMPLVSTRYRSDEAYISAKAAGIWRLILLASLAGARLVGVLVICFGFYLVPTFRCKCFCIPASFPVA